MDPTCIPLKPKDIPGTTDKEIDSLYLKNLDEKKIREVNELFKDQGIFRMQNNVYN